MIDPFRFSEPWKPETDGAEYFLYMQEQDQKQYRENQISKAIEQFQSLKAQGEDPNDFINEVLNSLDLDDVTSEEANHIMRAVDRY